MVVRMRIVLACVVLCLLVVLMTMQSAGPAYAGESSVVASANGGSQFKIENMFGFELIDVRAYSFNVKKFEDGRVQGHYEHRSFDDGVPFYVRGPLTCLNVDGNRAWVGGIIEDASEPVLEGWEMWFQVQDTGEGAGATDWTTLIGASPEVGSAQEYCDDAPDVLFPFDIEHGNIQVRDLE